MQQLVLVPLHVQREVVGAREAAAAHGTLERLGARVFAEVARELVGTGKLPAAAVPVAVIRFLT